MQLGKIGSLGFPIVALRGNLLHQHSAVRVVSTQRRAL